MRGALAGLLVGGWLALGAVAPRLPFTAHMLQHMLLVTLLAPVLASGLGSAAIRVPGSPLVASMVEGVLVWGWHAPALHHLAREHPLGFTLEQGSFLVAATWLWSAALASRKADRSAARPELAGILALLLTAMHMTLLGALIALAPRVLYAGHGGGALSALTDQQLGGAVMIVLGVAGYGAGALGLARRLLGEGS